MYLVVNNGVFAVHSHLGMDHEKHVVGFCVLEKIKDGHQLVVVVPACDFFGIAAAHFRGFLRLAGLL